MTPSFVPTRARDALSRLLPATLLALAPIAMAQDPAGLKEGFTCCNLHYNGDWISDANWSINAMIPAGTPIRILSYGRYRAFVEIDGKPMRLGQDYGREQESLERFATKWVSPKDPRERIATFPPAIREAIRLGRVVPGMDREQVLIAVGYPPTHQTLTLEAPVWHFWTTRTSRYQVIWGPDDRVKEVTAGPP